LEQIWIELAVRVLEGVVVEVWWCSGGSKLVVDVLRAVDMEEMEIKAMMMRMLMMHERAGSRIGSPGFCKEGVG
jgi:hypothetical protein